jgi:glyoxylate/hydroxypyruvate reductase
VAGWSRTRKTLPQIQCFAGAEELSAFLARTDILVCLLPLTPETRGILDRTVFRQLARDGVLGGPVIINAGRGGLQVEADILAALDDGTLAAATLDVFEREPLPAESPLWSHPKVTISPHNAADTDPEAISAYVVGQIERFERGLPLENVVDRRAGY